MLEIDAAQALAFRVAGHNLHKRTDPLTAVAACGLQELPPGWSKVALHARARGELDPSTVVTLNAMRGAPYVVPRADASVFTAALVPDDAGLEHLIGVATAKELAPASISPREAVDLVAEAAREGLRDGPLGRDEFHQAMRERLPDALLPWCPGCQSNHVRPSLWRALGPLGVTQMPAKATFALADYPRLALAEARAVLVRRFLRAYGPATAAHLATWAKTSPAHAKALFATVELAQVLVDGRKGWIAAQDERRLRRPPAARGVRLLGGFDPYVTQPDRETLMPDRALRRRLFLPVGRPGVVLHDGVLAGLWRGRKHGAVLEVEIEWLGREADISREANAVARVRGCDAARVSVVRVRRASARSSPTHSPPSRASL
jgi:Winged helix DNA-binding domain